MTFETGGKAQEIERQNLRSSFISFIKKAFERSNPSLYKELFDTKRTKPYVFSPYFGKEFKEGRIGKNISMIFSSGDPTIVSNLWNGILKLKQKGDDCLNISNTTYHLTNIILLPLKKIKKSEVIFKTIGISVLTDPHENADEFNKWYVTPNNLERFNEVLKERVQERLEHIKGIKKRVRIELVKIEGKKIEETIVPHYNGYVKGFRGEFLLKGTPQILQFLYDFGFGVRTGQGFGLLEIVKEL